jgi:hypothetical protein
MNCIFAQATVLCGAPRMGHCEVSLWDGAFLERKDLE